MVGALNDHTLQHVQTHTHTRTVNQLFKHGHQCLILSPRGAYRPVFTSHQRRRWDPCEPWVSSVGLHRLTPAPSKRKHTYTYTQRPQKKKCRQISVCISVCRISGFHARNAGAGALNQEIWELGTDSLHMLLKRGNTRRTIVRGLYMYECHHARWHALWHLHTHTEESFIVL